jgi:hypothetical protein
VIAWNGYDGSAQGAQEGARPLVLVAAPAVGEIAGRDDQLGPQSLDQRGQRRARIRALVGADMQVGDVKNPRWHGRTTL